MLMTGGRRIFGGGVPHRIMVNLRPRSAPTLRTTGRRMVGKRAGHRRQTADIPVDHSEERDDGGLVDGDRIEIAHANESADYLFDKLEV